jgi:hypothetical protein
MYVNGSARNAAHGTITISMPQKIFWPRGSRCLPVEEVSDLLGLSLERATPNEVGKLAREGEKPLTLVMGRCHIEYDHIIPRSKGGPNTVENIQILCRMCNLKKGVQQP